MADETIDREETATLMAKVFALVRACPAGRVTTYGWLGKAVGYPRGARMIGWFMNEATEDVPAQRVVNSKGELSGSWAFGQRGRMRQLLEAEGIVFTDGERIDMKKYGWDPTRDLADADREAILAGATAAAITPSARVMYQLKHDTASPFREDDTQG